MPNGGSSPELRPRDRDQTRRRDRRVAGLILLLTFFALLAIFSFGLPREFSGPARGPDAAAVSLHTGQLFGAFLLLLLVTYLASRRWAGLRGSFASLAALLAAAFVLFQSFQDIRLARSAAEVLALMRESGNVEAFAVRLSRIEDGSAVVALVRDMMAMRQGLAGEIMDDFPLLRDERLGSLLPPGTLSRESLIESRNLRRQALELLPAALAAEQGVVSRMRERMPTLIERHRIPEQFARPLEVAIYDGIETGMTDVELVYEQIAVVHRTAIEAHSHLINLYGSWDVGADGTVLFRTQAQADRYNRLVDAYNESWMIFARSFAAINQIPRQE